MARKRQSDADKVAAILAKFNIQTDEPVEVPEANYNHTNAVAMFGKVPQYFVLGECQHCKEKFAHNQPIPAGTRVGYCSDRCRKLAFEKNTGIKWGTVVSNREPWDGDPPMIITPEQLRNLRNIADWFTRNQTSLEIQDHDPVEELDDLEDFPSTTDQQDQQQYSGSALALAYEQASQRLEAALTNPPTSLYSSMLEQMFPEDDPFDF